MNYKIYVDNDIRIAETLPAEFYKKEEFFEMVKENIFLRCWHWIGDESMISEKNLTLPINLYPEFLDEPIVIISDEKNDISFFSNVCTHRGNILVKEKRSSKKIICSYHGRRFNNKGVFEFMPEFKETMNFPRQCDNLHKFP